MSTESTGGGIGGLARSRGAGASWMRYGAGAPGLERAEVHLGGCAFAPHRHDVYAIGVTTSGVQTFAYRGERPRVPAGPAARAAPGRDPRRRPRHRRRVRLPHPLRRPGTGPRRARPAAAAVRRRPGPEPLPAEPRRRWRPSAGTSRPRRTSRRPPRRSRRSPAATAGALARHFRRAYGTSPDRYRLQRRLALARAAIALGAPLARAAADAGFTDQSHLTRQFRRAYEFTPARWRDLQVTG